MLYAPTRRVGSLRCPWVPGERAPASDGAWGLPHYVLYATSGAGHLADDETVLFAAKGVVELKDFGVFAGTLAAGDEFAEVVGGGGVDIGGLLHDVFVGIEGAPKKGKRNGGEVEGEKTKNGGCTGRSVAERDGAAQM